MPTPEQIIRENVNAILDQAAALDGLITQFRAIKADVDQRELAIRKAMGELNPCSPVALAGQERLALYAHARMVDQSSSQLTVSQLAASAWKACL